MITALTLPQVPDSITLLGAIFGLGFLFVLWWVLEGKNAVEEDAYYEDQKQYVVLENEPISHVRTITTNDQHSDGEGIVR